MNEKLRIAVFGGSFNPPHIGHALVLQWLLWSGKADQVLVVPSDGHPLKKTTFAPLEVRVGLLNEMVEEMGVLKLPHPRGGRPYNQIEVLPVEGGLPKPVYSYDLMTHLREMYPEDDLHFLIGADILDEAHKWHLWEKLREDFPFIITGREGYESRTANPTFPDYSSTRIRELMSLGHRGWEQMVTPRVRAALQRGEIYPLGSGI